MSKFEKISLGTVQRPANEVMDETLKWLDGNSQKKFFALIHLYDPHTPYEPPSSFDTKYPDHPYHRENLGEHQEATHGFFIYQEAIHVPLIFVTPIKRFQGLSVSQVVSLVDVMPTMLEMAGFPIPLEVQGRSLVPRFFQPSKADNTCAYAETFYPRFHYGRSELQSFQTRRFKLIISPGPELYDLEQDSDDERNLALTEPAKAGS